MCQTGSFACFGISSYNTPGAGPAWGKLQAEIDPDTMWRINNTPVRLHARAGVRGLLRRGIGTDSLTLFSPCFFVTPPANCGR
jgi:hypothetical protein